MHLAIRSRITLAVAASVALVAGAATQAWAQAARPVRQRLSPATSCAPGWHDDQELTVGGVRRAFRFYVPAGMASHPPVVLLLHGGTQSMRKIFRPNAGGSQAWRGLADEEGFLLVVPNGTNARTGAAFGDDQNWNDCRSGLAEGGKGADDVGFITALIDWADRALGIDRSRVYATGASNGGGMSYRLAIERPDRIAAVAVFIMNLAADSECGPPRTPVPILICNGTADPLVPWDGGGVVGGRRGEVLSAAQTLRLWQRADRVSGAPPAVTHYPDLDRGDGSTVTCERFTPRPDGADVVFCTVDGGGHTMPSHEYPVPRWARVLVGGQNRDLEGARLAWEFLRGHRLQAAASRP